MSGLLDRGLRARDTDAHRVSVDDRAAIVEPLFRRRVLVCELGSDGLPVTIRIAVGDDAGTDRFLADLDEVLP